MAPLAKTPERTAVFILLSPPPSYLSILPLLLTLPGKHWPEQTEASGTFAFIHRCPPPPYFTPERSCSKLKARVEFHARALTWREDDGEESEGVRGNGGEGSKKLTTATSSLATALPFRLLSHPCLPRGEGPENKGIIEAQAWLHMPQMPI